MFTMKVSTCGVGVWAPTGVSGGWTAHQITARYPSTSVRLIYALSKWRWVPCTAPHRLQPQGCSPAAGKVPQGASLASGCWPKEQGAPGPNLASWMAWGTYVWLSPKRFVLAVTPVLNIYSLPSSSDQHGEGEANSKSFCSRFQGKSVFATI